jgi:Heparinase II/III-like protein/Heparinase II/III N-terminus
MSKLTTMLQVGRTFGLRDGMLRLQYELQRGSGLLSWRMRSVHGWESWRLERIVPLVSTEQILATRRHGTRKFFFSDARTLGDSVGKIVGHEGESAILAEANKILQGKLPVFGSLTLDCGFPPRWFQNPATGQSISPQDSWTHMRFASPAYGDLKFILEPSRFLFVYPLVRAYALTADERYPEGFWKSIEDWTENNPPMAGPLWICGQESSLRILAWSFALHSFIDSPSTTGGRIANLLGVIAAHAWRTAQTLGYARSQRSNHLISEAVGLWTTGVLFPELREAQVWKNLGAHLLREAVLDQITPEGVSQQHSFNYQRMILHLLLWTLRLAEIHDVPLHRDIRDRTQAALSFIRPWVDPVSGLVPRYGSDDGSLIFPLSLGSYQDFRPLLQLGAAVLNMQGLNPGPWDETAVWFGARQPTDKKIDRRLPAASTGYFRLGDADSWAMIRAGRYTRRPFQADQLHVDLWWKGINLACDPGTYLYNGPAPWNNGLAGTSVHNTVTIDGQDQMRRTGRFLWVDWAQASGRTCLYQQDRCADCFEGDHDGYKRLGVMHRRTVRWLKDCGWIVIDEIDGTRKHTAHLHWLVPDLPFEPGGEFSGVIFASKAGRIRWHFFCNVETEFAMVRAGKQVHTKASVEKNSLATIPDMPLLGWQSKTYGDLQPAISLTCQARAKLPLRFITVLLTNDQCGLKRRGSRISIVKEQSRNQSVQEIKSIDLIPTRHGMPAV